MRDRTGALRLIRTFAASALLAATGCDSFQPSSKPILAQVQEFPGNLVREVDPLAPTNRAAAQIEQTAKEAQAAIETLNAKLATFDMQAVNDQVARLNTLVGSITERVAQVPPELGGNLARQVEAANLGKIREEIDCLLATAEQQMAALRLEEINGAVAGVRASVDELTPKLRALDVEAANRLMTETAKLKPGLDQLISNAGNAIGNLDRTMAELTSSFSGLRYTIILINVLLAVAIVGTTGWAWRRARA